MVLGITTDLAKISLKPDEKNIINLVRDFSILYSKLKFVGVVGALGDILFIATNTYSLARDFLAQKENKSSKDYISSGLKLINGFSVILNNKFIPYGASLYFCLNILNLLKDLYEGESVSFLIQASGIAGMIIAPSFTSVAYVLIYSAQNLNSLYELYIDSYPDQANELINEFESLIKFSGENDNYHPTCSIIG